MRVSASTPIRSVTASASMRGCAAMTRLGRSSSHRSGSPARALPIGCERQSFAHSRCTACSSNAIVAQPRLQLLDALIDRAIEQRLHLAGEIDPHAAQIEVGIGDCRPWPTGSARSATPASARPRAHGDIAAHVGALIERAAADACRRRARRSGRADPPSAPARPPASPESWPVACTVPVSGVDDRDRLRPPATQRTALDGPLDFAVGDELSEPGSRACPPSRAAHSLPSTPDGGKRDPTGVTMTEVRLIGGSGGNLGQRRLTRAHSARGQSNCIASRRRREGRDGNNDADENRTQAHDSANPTPCIRSPIEMRSQHRDLSQTAVWLRPQRADLPCNPTPYAATVLPGHLQRSAITHFSHSGRRATQV